MKKSLLSIFATAVLMVITTVGFAQSTFTKITSTSDLEAGANYLIVAHSDELGVLAMGYQRTSNRLAVVVSENGESITVTPGTDPNSETDVFQFTLGGSAGAWTFFDEVKGGYLYASSSSANQLKTQNQLDANGEWSISFNADGTAEVVSQGENTRNNMRFNPNTPNSPLFSCYAETSNIDTRVSLYKLGGAPVINPEPTNYPTNFAATVNEVSVTLTWTDATGAQLPSKYLVLASTGNITKPTDGTPVANSDMAKNVNYGVQTVTFTGLDAGISYIFAIFPYTNSGDNIDYKTDGSYPTALATTESVSYMLDEGFDTDLGEFTAISVIGDQEWHQASYQGTTYANMNGYASGADHENEDWLISPEIDLGTGVVYDVIYLEFRTAMKFDGPALNVMISTNYYGGAPSDADWEDITDAFDYSSGDYEWVESGRVNILDLVSKLRGSFRVAFVYRSTDEAASSWEIDYVKVIAGYPVAVSENTVSSVSVYPNPARDVVSFNLENDAQVSIFDMTGRMVNQVNMVAGQGQCQIADLENGVYFLNIRYTDGKKEVARFVKF
ncbi:MAG: choice-of-anchor J domain-containing protein [Bacteroidales bacterium]|nr:choice-of-anchor J domain-containing protein [Bacteroidales bacterium]